MGLEVSRGNHVAECGVAITHNKLNFIEASWHGLENSYSFKPQILLEKSVIKGTRLTVEFILGLFAEGWTE